MTDRDDSPTGERRPEDPDPGTRPAAAAGSTPDEGTTPPVHERWWWTGTFRAVLGGIVVGYQWPVLTSGEAGPFNWLLAVVGAAIVVWGASMVLTEHRRRS